MIKELIAKSKERNCVFMDVIRNKSDIDEDTRQVNVSEQTVKFVREGAFVPRKMSNRTKKATQCKLVMLSVEKAIRCIRTYFNQTIEDIYGRYLSWQHLEMLRKACKINSFMVK